MAEDAPGAPSKRKRRGVATPQSSTGVQPKDPTQNVLDSLNTAVWRGIQKSFAKIKRSMHADGKPQRASAPNREAPQQTNQHNGSDTDPVLATIPQMNPAEEQRQ